MAKKALLIGINDYAPAGPSGSDLNGCVNDVKDMANTLVICGFNSKSIRIRTDKRATKAGVTKGLDWLVSGAKKGDVLVFYYSGHGSQVVDTEGDEIDKKDEILCPHDIDFAEGIYIADDDLRTVFSKIPAGVNLEVILDSCHSGTGTRALRALKQLPEEQKVSIRYLPPPIDYAFHMDYDPKLPTRRILRPKPGQKNVAIVSGMNHTLWAACAPNQTSEETAIEGTIRGAFTYHFCQILRRTNGEIKRVDLQKLASAALKRGGFAQIPQIETSKEELLDQPFR